MSAVSSPVTHPLPPPQHPQVVAPPPVRAPKRGRWGWAVALVVLAIVLGVVAYRAISASSTKQTGAVTVPTATVTTGDLERRIRVAGQTTAIDFSNVTAPSLKGPESRDMVLMYVAPAGSWVKKGTLIAQIDAQALADHIDDLGDTIEAATADVNKRRAEQAIELETLQQTIRVAKSAWDKAKLDYGAAEVKTDVERQLLKLTLDESEAAYKEQLGDLQQKKVAQAAELKVLDLTRERHLRHRNRHRNDLKTFTIYAAMDGLVVMQPIFRGSEMGQFQQGDRLWAGQPFMKVVNTRTMQVEGTVNQTESGEFRIGQEAKIHLDAFPNMEFTGKVHSLGALAVSGWRQNSYIRTIPIRIRIEGSDPKLIPDLSASADVLITRAQDKTLAPRSAFHKEDGKLIAYVKDGDTFELREVQLGPVSGLQAVVTSGLKPGDVVRLN